MKISSLKFVAVVISILALTSLSAPVQARSTELVEPPPVTIMCHLSADQMTKAIISGGAVRGWIAVKQEPGNIELKFVKGAYKHVINVDVSYSKNSFSIRYKDSSGLNYKVKKNGVRKIHPRPITWMMNLNMDIESKTVELCSE